MSKMGKKSLDVKMGKDYIGGKNANFFSLLFVSSVVQLE